MARDTLLPYGTAYAAPSICEHSVLHERPFVSTLERRHNATVVIRGYLMAELTLYSARACPFAHRTRLVLAEKRLDFELVEIDLRQKPAWFSTISNYGKVPALKHHEHRIADSAIVNE